MLPPASAQMAPTGRHEKGKRRPESDRSAAKARSSLRAIAAVVRDDEKRSRPETPWGRPRRGDVGGMGWRRARGEGTDRKWEGRQGGGRQGGGRRGRGGRRGSRRGAAGACGEAAMRALPLALAVACCAQLGHGPGFIPGVQAELRPETDLTSNCFNFPERNFDRRNSIMAVNGGNTPYLPLETGGDAIDFTLHDLEGRPWNLRETLEQVGQPVVMIFGMWTCPAFQGYGTTPPWDMSSYWDESELVEAYKGRATFVHIYGPEPHPSMPGTNFDKGVTWQSYWSALPQHTTYEERAATAERIVDMVHPSQTILVDYLPGNPYSELIQPVWCSYAMGARPATVISPEGKIFFQRGWFHSEHVAGAIEQYYCLRERQEQQQRREGQPEQQEVDNGCLSSGASGSDMGDDGSSPLAGVLPGSAASLPPWLR